MAADIAEIEGNFDNELRQTEVDHNSTLQAIELHKQEVVNTINSAFQCMIDTVNKSRSHAQDIGHQFREEISEYKRLLEFSAGLKKFNLPMQNTLSEIQTNMSVNLAELAGFTVDFTAGSTQDVTSIVGHVTCKETTNPTPQLDNDEDSATCCQTAQPRQDKEATSRLSLEEDRECPTPCDLSLNYHIMVTCPLFNQENPRLFYVSRNTNIIYFTDNYLNFTIHYSNAGSNILAMCALPKEHQLLLIVRSNEKFFIQRRDVDLRHYVEQDISDVMGGIWVANMAVCKETVYIHTEVNVISLPLKTSYDGMSPTIVDKIDISKRDLNGVTNHALLGHFAVSERVIFVTSTSPPTLYMISPGGAVYNKPLLDSFQELEFANPSTGCITLVDGDNSILVAVHTQPPGKTIILRQRYRLLADGGGQGRGFIGNPDIVLFKADGSIMKELCIANDRFIIKHCLKSGDEWKSKLKMFRILRTDCQKLYCSCPGASGVCVQGEDFRPYGRS